MLIHSHTFTLLMTLDISSHLRHKDAYFQELCIKVITISSQCRLFQELNTQNILRLN